jgi:N-terminal acetyltransferase 2
MVLDFGIAFIGINLLGAEQVSRFAASVKDLVANVLHSKPPEPGREEIDPVDDGHEGLYAMLVLAYTIHKTIFLPFRVGLTAYLTPRLVGWLGQRGWVGGEGTRRAALEMRERLRSTRNRD